MNDMRQWMTVSEMLTEGRVPSVSAQDVNDRISRIGIANVRATRSDIQAFYRSIMSRAEFEDGMMVVYRGMTIEEPEWFANLKPGDNLGRYWAYDRRGALVGSFDEPNVLLIGLVQPSNVDWATTIAQEIAVGGEHEITLGGVPVVLKAAEPLNGASFDLSHLYEQSFWT